VDRLKMGTTVDMNLVRTSLFAFVSAVSLSACDDASKKQPAASVASALPAPAPPKPGAETLSFSNANSKAGFVGSKVTGSHEGGFERFRGTLRLAEGKAEGSSVEVEIDTDSLSIEPAKLETHLKSPDFLDTAKFPKATFKSTEVKAGGANGATHTVTGNLNLHGKERSISFPATIKVAESEVAAKADFSINRRDFDIVYTGMANDLIRDDVVIKLDVHAPRDRATPAKDTRPN
jgi:polyisoprenoid-binding protein YceI